VRGTTYARAVADILVVEDDDRIARNLLAGLEMAGHAVVHTSTGAQALTALANGSCDLVLLDLGLPDVDGFALCRDLRQQQPSVVIVVLTARVDEMDVVEGLESGADDYLTKPFRMTELQARVRAHLRRGAIEQPDDAPGAQVGALQVDFRARRAWIADQELTLRAKEFDLLARLAKDAGMALRRETLMADVWDENWFGSTKTLDVHVATLRRKLEAAATEQGVLTPSISTLRGHGYRLEAVPDLSA
jgi:DNA-binding response OmpR family regulator